MNVNYLKIAFEIYQSKITQEAKEIIQEACQKLRPISYSEDSENCYYVNETLTIGTSLFELYLILQQIAK